MFKSVTKRSVMVGGRRTSVSLEEAFWDRLNELARRQDRSLSSLVTEIDETRGQRNLSSAIRCYVLDAAMEQIASLRGRAPTLASSPAAGNLAWRPR